MKRLAAMLAAVAAGLLCLAVPATAAPAAHHNRLCPGEHHADGRQSLDGISRSTGVPVAGIIFMTDRCESELVAMSTGGMARYVNQGDFDEPMVRGTAYWLIWALG